MSADERERQRRLVLLEEPDACEVLWDEEPEILTHAAKAGN